jgi:hypothetical protein
MSMSFGMDFWYDIVKSYDDPKSKDPERKNDGTYSRPSVVILLIYLTFGEDHPYHIAEYFQMLRDLGSPDKVALIPYASNLRTPKVGTLLNKMKEDGLVLVREEKTSKKPRKIYSINPRIIQSPIRDGHYPESDGSTFEIPLKMVEDLLTRKPKKAYSINPQDRSTFEIPLKKTEDLLIWKDWKIDECRFICERDILFTSYVFIFQNEINYFDFIKFIQSKAECQERKIQGNWDRDRKPSSLENLLMNYEMIVAKNCCRRVEEHFIPHIPNIFTGFRYNSFISKS